MPFRLLATSLQWPHLEGCLELGVPVQRAAGVVQVGFSSRPAGRNFLQACFASRNVNNVGCPGSVGVRV